MADDLQRLEAWVAPLLERLSESERRNLARTIARDLRAGNTATMRAQQAPDGTAWKKRKKKLRDAQGRIRRERRSQDMFVKLRTAKYLQAQATPNEAIVAFAGRAERIARVHHFGLEDKVEAAGPNYHYPARALIGITEPQIERIRDLLAAHLAGKT